MADGHSLANGIPMSLEQMRIYLQDFHRKPIVLRLLGTTKIVCPYCLKTHEHFGPGGHYVAACDESERFDSRVFVGERCFTANYGYQIYDYIATPMYNELVVPEDNKTVLNMMN
jgi:hypothetical protein